jgi:hypothetical protein
MPRIWVFDELHVSILQDAGDACEQVKLWGETRRDELWKSVIWIWW